MQIPLVRRQALHLLALSTVMSEFSVISVEPLRQLFRRICKHAENSIQQCFQLGPVFWRRYVVCPVFCCISSGGKTMFFNGFSEPSRGYFGWREWLLKASDYFCIQATPPLDCRFLKFFAQICWHSQWVGGKDVAIWHNDSTCRDDFCSVAVDSQRFKNPLDVKLRVTALWIHIDLEWAHAGKNEKIAFPSPYHWWGKGES